MTEFNQEQAQQYLAMSLAELEAELALYDGTDRGAADGARIAWQKIAAPVRQRICAEWDWCEVRQDSRFENDYDLYVAVLSILTTRVLHLSLDADVYLITAILVKRGLDGFCGCP
jgi:hypothetical protein